MPRFREYLRILVWNAGLGYVALWTVTLWALDDGGVFDRSGVCRPDTAKVLFYWMCDPASAYGILAAVVNAALTMTVWAPVYIAAATVQSDAIAIALPIVAVHVIGLPAAIFVSMRLLLMLFAGIRARWSAPARPAASRKLQT
jgi:hypothetical protein